MENTHKMQNTPLGLIPEGWSARPLGDLCEIHGRIGFRGYTKADLVRKGEGAITFSPSDIDNQRISYKDCDYISWAKYAESPEIQVKEGDILFCKTASIGKCAQIWDLKEKATINPQFVLLNDFKCNSSLLYYMLAFSSFQNRVLVITGGSTILTISQEAMKKQLIPIPDDPDEQKRIADTLLSIDKILGALDEAIAKKRQIKEGLMQQLLTGKTRLPGFSGKWEERRLDSFEIVNGSMLKSSEYETGNVPVIAGGQTPAGFHSKANRPANTITISGSGAYAGFVSFHTVPIFASDCSTIVNPKNADIIYMYFCLLSKQNDIYKCQAGGAQPHVHAKDIKDITIMMPSSVEEQKAISVVLTKSDDEIKGLEAQLDKYALIKQGMMQELLTGKTRLI